MHGAHHGEVFQGHLRGAVGADLGPGVGAAQPDAGLGDGGHPDEVVGAGEERGEGGRERHVSAHGHADGGGDELLLGDEHLEVTLGIGLGELLGVGGVAHLPIQGHHVAAGADRRERLAEGQPGGDLGTQLIAGQAHLAAGPDPRRGGLRPRPADHQVPLPAQLDDGPLGHLRRQRPAVPALAVLHLRKPLSLEGAGHDHGGLARAAHRRQCLVDLAEVVPVDGDGTAAERLNPFGICLQIPAQLGRPALAEAVHVDDRGQVAQPVVGRLVQRLPHRPFRHLAVAAQHPHPVRQLIEIPPGQRHPDSVGQPLAQRAGRDVNPRQRRGGVALQPRAEPPVPGHQLLVRDDARRLEHGVQQRRRVPLGEDQVVAGRVVRLPPVVAQIPGLQHRHHIGGRHARRRMTGPGGGAAPDRIDPQLLGQLADVLQCLYGHGGLLSRRGRVMHGRAYGVRPYIRHSRRAGAGGVAGLRLNAEAQPELSLAGAAREDNGRRRTSAPGARP